jgi:hypothetical protein
MASGGEPTISPMVRPQRIPGRTSRPRHGQLHRSCMVLPLASFAFLNRLSEEVFDLAVDAAQFVLSPGFELSPELGIDTK